MKNDAMKNNAVEKESAHQYEKKSELMKKKAIKTTIQKKLVMISLRR